MPIPINFESLHKFHIALREVIVLICRSKKEELKCRAISNIYLKAALILLTSKFEAFLENVVSEYITLLNDSVMIEFIPEVIKIHHTKELFEKFEIYFQKIGEEDKRKIISDNMKDLALLWKNDTNAKPIQISNKFNFGKHGEKAINELFKRIGFSNILDEFVIVKKVQTLDGEEDEDIDFKAKVNELTHKRNTILHNDTSITFTKEEIIDYIKYLKQFSQKLVDKLIESIENCQIDT